MMENPDVEAIHHALSVLSDESHAAIVFMLNDRYGVKLNGLVPVNIDKIRSSLEDLFGESADIFIRRMGEYLPQKVIVPG